MTDGRFYWLKLKRDFFKRHDIRIIESMPNGKDYILFYLKLLCESVDHDGNLRFSEQIPYNEDMLSTITNTNVDVVRSAIGVFTNLEMMEILDDGTYFMSEVQKMIGSAVDNNNANRQRRFREKKRTLALPDRYDGVTENNESKSKSIEKDTEKDTEIDNNANDHQNDHRKTSNKAYEAEFEQVWERYPKKQGKQNALKAFIKARKEGVSLDEISDGVDRYSISVKYTDMQYVKQGSTWFSQRRWEDNYYLSQPRRDNGGKTARVAQDLRDGMDMIDAWVAENGGTDEPF